MSDCSCRSHGSFLTAKGLKEAAQRARWDWAVAGMDESRYLDKVGSVSAPPETASHWPDDAIIEEQHRRFLNGS